MVIVGRGEEGPLPSSTQPAHACPPAQRSGTTQNLTPRPRRSRAPASLSWEALWRVVVAWLIHSSFGGTRPTQLRLPGPLWPCWAVLGSKPGREQLGAARGIRKQQHRQSLPKGSLYSNKKKVAVTPHTGQKIFNIYQKVTIFLTRCKICR